MVVINKNRAAAWIPELQSTRPRNLATPNTMEFREWMNKLVTRPIVGSLITHSLKNELEKPNHGAYVTDHTPWAHASF